MHTNNNIAKGKIVFKKKALNILHPKYYEPNTHLTFLSQEIQLKLLSGVFEKKKNLLAWQLVETSLTTQ